MNLNQLNMTQLYYFWRIAQTESVTQAAKQLAISQPALSEQLKAFESAIGASLFERRNRGLHLNPRGKVILGYANRIFRLASDFVENIDSDLKNLPETIVVGVLPSISKYKLARLMKPIINLDNFSVQVIEGEIRFLQNELERSSIDILFSDEAPSLTEASIEIRQILDRHFVAVVAPRLIDTTTDASLSSHLKRLDFLNFSSESTLHFQIMDYLRNMGVKPRVRLEADDVNLLRAAAEEGYGVAFLPESVVEHSIEAGRLHRIQMVRKFRSNIYALYSNKNSAVKGLLSRSAKMRSMLE